MASKRSNELGWYNSRLAIFLTFTVMLSGGFYIFSLLFSPEGPEIRTTINAEGYEVSEYYYPYSANPVQVDFKDRNGDLAEKWFDRNTNGHFESKCFYIDGKIVNMEVSLPDDGVVDLKRLIEGENILEQYDRNRDGYWEEKHYVKDGKRVKETIDRNNDGNPEQQILYDSSGTAVKLILDHNSDGKPDVILPREPRDEKR